MSQPFGQQAYLLCTGVLQTFNLTWCCALTDATMLAIAKYCTRLLTEKYSEKDHLSSDHLHKFPTNHLQCIPMPPISYASTCVSGLHWLSFFGNLNVTTSAVEAGGKGVVGWVPSPQKSPEKTLPLRPCQPPVLVPPCDTLTFAGWQQLHHMAMAKV